MPTKRRKRIDPALWAIVDRVERKARGDLTRSIAAFRRELSALDDRALVRVEAAFCAAMQRAYDWKVRAASYVIHGGTADDSFWDFRAGLVALGRDVFAAAIRDPDTLAAIDDVQNRTVFEGFQYVPGALVEQRGLTSRGGGHGSKRGGLKPWTDDAQLRAWFPKLTARFGC